jgi:NAD(P)-dependent dehydrogenase (short-subunit alcohol dehydrogenase family)
MTGVAHEDSDDRVAVVTGSTRGIGLAIATALAEAGWSVVVSSRTAEAVDAAVAGIAAAGGSVAGIPADVSRQDDLQALYDFALTRFGRIDAWVNNAGVSLGYKRLDESSAEQLARIVSINLTGTALGTALVLPYLREHGGHILNLTGRGHKGEPTPHTALYAATKTAIASLTGSVAAENRRFPVSVNALVPGMVATDFYDKIDISPTMGEASDNWRYALAAFGVPAADVGREVVRILSLEPGAETGRVYSLLTFRKTVRGIVKITGDRLAGRLKPEP